MPGNKAFYESVKQCRDTDHNETTPQIIKETVWQNNIVGAQTVLTDK